LRGQPGIVVLEGSEIDNAAVAVVVVDRIDEDALRVIRAVQRQGCPRVVVVGSSLDGPSVLSAVEAGACGPVADLSPDLESSLPELDRRLREVVEGQRWRLEQRSSWGRRRIPPETESRPDRSRLAGPETGPSGNTARSIRSSRGNRWLSERVASAMVVVPETMGESAGGSKSKTT